MSGFLVSEVLLINTQRSDQRINVMRLRSSSPTHRSVTVWGGVSVSVLVCYPLPFPLRYVTREELWIYQRKNSRKREEEVNLRSEVQTTSHPNVVFIRPPDDTPQLEPPHVDPFLVGETPYLTLPIASSTAP